MCHPKKPNATFFCPNGLFVEDTPGVVQGFVLTLSLPPNVGQVQTSI